MQQPNPFPFAKVPIPNNVIGTVPGPTPFIPIPKPVNQRPIVPLVAQPNVIQPSQGIVPQIPKPIAQPIIVPQPQTIVPQPIAQPIIVPQPQTIVPQPIAQPIIVPQPQTIVPQPIAQPIIVPQPQTIVPQPQMIRPVIQPTTVAFPQVPVPQPIVPQSTRTTIAPTQGGMLRQFGGGVGTLTITQTPQMTAAPTIKITEETGYSVLIRLIPAWNGTQDQVQRLTTLQYEDGSLIIDPKRRDIIIEIVGMLINNPFEEIIDFLTDAPGYEYILWDQKSLDEGRVAVAREIIIHQAEEIGVKGVGRCRFCQSEELVFATKQLRSGDEPATVFVRCVLCNKQWRQ